MEFDRFDIVEAHYLFLNDYHEGKHSKKYARLCHILSYFKPSPLSRGYEDLSENGQAIYDALVAKNTIDTKQLDAL